MRIMRIEAVLREQGKTQTWLADKAGVNRASINRIVNGVEPAYPKRGKRIADALGWEGDPAKLFEEIEIEV